VATPFESDDSSDARLIAQAARGDLDAFNQLVDRYERLVFAVCLRLLRNRESAEDATQESFIRAFTALRQFQGASFRAWLARIATNYCYDLLRAGKRRPAESLDAQVVEAEPWWSSEPAPADPAQQAAQRALAARLEAALGQLPEDQRLVVLLYDVHGYSYEEIAEATGTTLGTVKSRLSRARARLRDDLRADRGSRELFEAVSRQLFGDEPSRGE
jgi:RNA polymerase sigma-70 factor (ECF subfamily)